MNETVKELMERKSVRDYTDREITEEAERTILLSATAAPTAGNQQLYTIIKAESESVKRELSVLCDNQPFIARAKLVLVFCADCKKWYDAYIEAGANPRAPGVGDLLLAVSDACIAAQNAVTAAESMGIGSCYIGDVMENREKMCELLAIPEYVFPCAMLVFGYPTEQQKNRQKIARCELSDIVCNDRYVIKDGEKLRSMFMPRCGIRGYDDWMWAFCERKYNSDFSREMTRSVGEYLKEFEK